MPEGVSRFLLPFSLPSEERRIPISNSMELAAIFCLAEINREKGGGLISKKAPEEIMFISKVYYPLWLVPWGRRTLLFDGFGLMSHKISFDVLPDAGVFVREIKGGSNKFEVYLAFLSHNLNYFKGFTGKGEKVIKGLIMDSSFIKDFLSLFSNGRYVKSMISDALVLSPSMDLSTVKESLMDLSNLRDALKDDVVNLKNIIKLLVRTTNKHCKAINRIIERINRRSEGKIDHFKSTSMKEIEKLRGEYDRKIIEITDQASSLIQNLSQEKVRLESEKKRLTIYLDRCTTEISAARERGEPEEEERWKDELEKCRMELSEIDRRLEEIDRRITDVEPSRDLEISRLKSEYNSRVEEIMSGLKEIEATRDAQIRMYQQSLSSLEDLTAKVIAQINRLIELRNAAIEELNEMGLPQTRRKVTLVHLPFYLVCCRQDLKRRYVTFVPSIASSLSGVTRLKSVLRSFKVKIFFQEFSLPITGLINRFVDLIEENPIFEEKIINACCRINILKVKDLRDEVSRGLVELKDEGWLTDDEYELFHRRLREISA